MTSKEWKERLHGGYLSTDWVSKLVADLDAADAEVARLREKLSDYKAYTIAEVRKRERAAYYSGWITGCVSAAMTQEQIKAAALREYPEEDSK